MSDRQLAELLDRAVHHAPQMHLTGDDMLAAGRGRVRRRRAVGIGGALGAAAIVAALWGGLAGGDGTPLGTIEIHPAGTVWEPGEPVEGTLFSGFQTIDDDQVAHTYDARLGREVTDGPVTLTLSDNGQTVEQIPARSEVPGLEVFAGERMTVAVWTEPGGVVASVPLVGPVDPGGPATVQRTEVGGEELAYAVWAGDVVPLPEVVRDVYLVGRDDVAAVSGTSVEAAVLRAGDERAVAWGDASRGVWGYAVDGQDSPSVEQLGHRPAQATMYSYNQDDTTSTLAILPEGAELVDVALADGDSDSTVIHGRAVVLTEARSDDLPDVLLTLGAEQVYLAAYLDDLFTLDTVGGGALTVVPAGDTTGGLALQERTGAVPVEVSAEELGEGLVVRPVRDKLVVVASGWDPGPAVLSASRVEMVDAGGPEWVVPDDVAQVSMPDGTLVTLMTVDASDGAEVTGVGHQAGGAVEPWVPHFVLSDGVSLREDGDDLVPVVDGRPLERVDDGSLSGVRHHAGRTAADVGYLVATGTDPAWTLVPVVKDSDGAVRLAPEARRESWSSDSWGATVLAVDGSLTAEGRSRVVGLAAGLGTADAANTWTLLGAASSAHVVIDPGAVVTVAPEDGLWMLYPQGSVDPDALAAGRVGETLDLPGDDGLRVVVHRRGEPPASVDGLPPTHTYEIPQHDLVVSAWTTD